MSAGWLPIDTAPRDGTKILLVYLAYEDKLPVYQIAYWHNAKTATGITGWYGLGGMAGGTHWMPLPEPPPVSAPLFDVIEVELKAPHRVRVLDTDKTEENAEAAIPFCVP